MMRGWRGAIQNWTGGPSRRGPKRLLGVILWRHYWSDMMNWFTLIAGIFLFVLAVLWFFLPFAVFGIQPKIDSVLAEIKRTNELLEGLQASFQTIADSATQPSEPPPPTDHGGSRYRGCGVSGL